MKPENEKQKQSDYIRQQTEQFLKRGGKIREYPQQGATTDNKLTRKHIAARLGLLYEI